MDSLNSLPTVIKCILTQTCTDTMKNGLKNAKKEIAESTQYFVAKSMASMAKEIQSKNEELKSMARNFKKLEADVKALHLRVAFEGNKSISELTPVTPVKPVARKPEIIPIDHTQDQSDSDDDDSPTPAPTNDGWITRGFKTPENAIKFVVPTSNDPVGLKMESFKVGSTNFCSIEATKSWKGEKFPKDCYVTHMNDEDCTALNINHLENKFNKLVVTGLTLCLQKFNSAQIRSISKQREKDVQLKRERLWEKYKVLFSSEYRAKNKNKHFRYRPDCQSCSASRSVEVLSGLIAASCKLISEKLSEKNDEDKLFEKMRDAENSDWETMMAKVEGREIDLSGDDSDDEEIMSYKPPADFTPSKKRKHDSNTEGGSSSKKQKMSLREEFIAAGNPGVVFDSLRGKMSEEQLRGIYKF